MFSFPSPIQTENSAESSSNGVSRLSLAANNLNESSSGTPKVVLRQQINLKDETIRSLTTDLKELEEYTKLESEVVVDEVREELKRMNIENARLKQDLATRFIILFFFLVFTLTFWSLRSQNVLY